MGDEFFGIVFGYIVGIAIGWIAWGGEQESSHRVEPTVKIVTTNGVSDTTYIYNFK